MNDRSMFFFLLSGLFGGIVGRKDLRVSRGKMAEYSRTIISRLKILILPGREGSFMSQKKKYRPRGLRQLLVRQQIPRQITPIKFLEKML